MSSSRSARSTTKPLACELPASTRAVEGRESGLDVVCVSRGHRLYRAEQQAEQEIQPIGFALIMSVHPLCG